ncbi:hypothetical protein [Streptomyces subrutilus]|uniref:hypothetical protein n=1 Tax=Streptomyces subrutilus TaxID=36818 RepID=UPI002E0DE7CA|nr:hypothetical protein OG479_35060 [Streptomyces subrutilus]WSJ34588.1 hypothetical protein OG479_34915 [Streptomyces subrutilus]
MTTSTRPNFEIVLLSEVIDGIGNEQMIAASRLLARHDEGFWLRRFLDDPRDSHDGVVEIPNSDNCQTYHGGPVRHLDWMRIGERLRMGTFEASSSEEAILAVAASLVGHHEINLRRILSMLDGDQVDLVTRAIAEAG